MSLHRDNATDAVDIVRFLLDCDSKMASLEVAGQPLLAWTCREEYMDSNLNAALQVINLLYDACPESIRKEDRNGMMLLHHHCLRQMNEKMSRAILKLLLEKCPEAARHAQGSGSLPIHLASIQHSPEFCRMLIEAYPGSERICNDRGKLPFHHACIRNTVATVEYLYKLYPDAINHTSREHYPIHFAITSMEISNPTAAVEIVKFLLSCDPTLKFQKVDGKSLLHFACQRKYTDSNLNAALQIINLLYDAFPDFVREEDNGGRLPLHHLCMNKYVDEAAAVEILKLFIAQHPDSIRHTDNYGCLPILHAFESRSPEFCRVLIEAYPGSERKCDTRGRLPLDYACMTNTVATVQYLYKLYPDAIYHTTIDVHYPIHMAIMGMRHRESPIAAVEIVKFLLDCDSKMAPLEVAGISLLYLACRQEYTDSSIQAGIQMIKVIYDAHPEAIEHRRISSDIQRYHQQVRAFINSQLVYSRQAKDHRQMTTPDHNGRLPLHTALQNNVRLGSIKLLVKGNPSAVLSPDISGATPLHIACQHHDSANSVMQHLVTLDATTLEAVDRDGNTALHLACRDARHEIIAMLLEKYDNVSVSKRNAQRSFPLICFGKAMRSLIGKALHTRRVSFVF